MTNQEQAALQGFDNLEWDDRWSVRFTGWEPGFPKDCLELVKIEGLEVAPIVSFLSTHEKDFDTPEAWALSSTATESIKELCREAVRDANPARFPKRS